MTFYSAAKIKLCHMRIDATGGHPTKQNNRKSTWLALYRDPKISIDT